MLKLIYYYRVCKKLFKTVSITGTVILSRGERIKSLVTPWPPSVRDPGRMCSHTSLTPNWTARSTRRTRAARWNLTLWTRRSHRRDTQHATRYWRSVALYCSRSASTGLRAHTWCVSSASRSSAGSSSRPVPTPPHSRSRLAVSGLRAKLVVVAAVRRTLQPVWEQSPATADAASTALQYTVTYSNIVTPPALNDGPVIACLCCIASLFMTSNSDPSHPTYRNYV